MKLLRISFGIVILTCFLLLSLHYVEAGNITIENIADEHGGFTNEKIIEVSDSGSKNLYGIDNLVGAKNKIISYENKDKYIIDGYTDEDGTFYKGIYANGEQNNMDKKECYINGTLSKQPRFYGKDCTILRINYTQYIHDEITVVFNNTIGDRHNTITNNLGIGDTWSNNGKIFDNQIAGLTFINTTEGNYTFNHWEDENHNIITDYFFEWTGNLTATHIYTAIYNFTANPIPEPENETDDNATGNETEDPQNETNNETDIDPTPEPQNNTDTTNTTDTNTTNTTNTNTNPNDNTNATTINNNTNDITTTEEQETITTNLQEHETGNIISNFLTILILLIFFAVLLRKIDE